MGNRVSIVHIHPERPIRIHVGGNQRRQRTEVFKFHAVRPIGIRQHALNNQRVDIYQTVLQQMEFQEGELLVIQTIGGDLATLSEEDEGVSSMPRFTASQATNALDSSILP